MTRELPLVERVYGYENGSIVVFSEPYKTGNLLEHTGVYLEGLFGDKFKYKPGEPFDPDIGHWHERKQGLTESFSIENGLDKKVPVPGTLPVYVDGVGYLAYVDSQRTKISLTPVYIRGNRLPDFLKINGIGDSIRPHDFSINPNDFSPNKLLFDFANSRKAVEHLFVLTLPNGREALSRYFLEGGEKFSINKHL